MDDRMNDYGQRIEQFLANFVRAANEGHTPERADATLRSEAELLLAETRRRRARLAAKQAELRQAEERLRELDQMDARGERPYGRVMDW